MLLPHLFALISLTIGLLVSFFFLFKIFKKYFFKGHLTNIEDCKSGYVLIEGLADKKGDYVLSPFRNIQVILAQVDIYLFKSKAPNSSQMNAPSNEWRIDKQYTFGENFNLIDDTGTIEVDLKNAKFDIEKGPTKFSNPLSSISVDEEISQFFKDHEFLVSPLTKMLPIKIIESILRESDKVFVYGKVKDVNGKKVITSGINNLSISHRVKPISNFDEIFSIVVALILSGIFASFFYFLEP